MKKMLLLYLLFIPTISCAQEISDLLYKRAAITVEIQDSLLADFVKELLPEGGALPLVIDPEEELVGMVASYEDNIVKINKEFLETTSARCLAPIYVHEISHLADFKGIRKIGLALPLTYDEEFVAEANRYIFIVDKMKKHGLNYYDSCTETVDVKDIVLEGGVQGLRNAVQKRYGDRAPLPMTRDYIHDIIKNFNEEDKHSYIYAKYRRKYIDTNTLPSADDFFSTFCLSWWYAIDTKDLQDILAGKNDKFNRYEKWMHDVVESAERGVEFSRAIHQGLLQKAKEKALSRYEKKAKDIKDRFNFSF